MCIDGDLPIVCLFLTHHTPLSPPHFLCSNFAHFTDRKSEFKVLVGLSPRRGLSHHPMLREKKMNSVFQPPFQPKTPPLTSLRLPSLRVLFESLLSAAPLGVPNAFAFAPLGYAVRFCPTLFALANRVVQKLTTHSATFQNFAFLEELETHMTTCLKSKLKTKKKQNRNSF